MSDTIDATAASLIDAHRRRFALAGEVGRMRGAIRLALAALDAADGASPELVQRIAAEARNALRLALEAESERA